MTNVPALIDGPGGRLVKVVQEVLAAFGDPDDLRSRPVSLRVPGGIPASRSSAGGRGVGR